MSDIFQFFIMVGSVFLVFFLSIKNFGIQTLMQLPDSYFHPLGKFTATETLVWGFIALSYTMPLIHMVHKLLVI